MSTRDDDSESHAPDSVKRAVKTTIVGGQPPGNDRALPPVPVGLEELMGMAAVNPDFGRALLADRSAAVAASGVALTTTESQILGAIDDRTLATMVTRVEGGVPNRDRRAFLSRASAALLVLAGGGAVAAAASCGDRRAPRERPEVSGGARPNYPDPEHPIEPPMARDAATDDAGVADAGLPDADLSKAGTGVRPDRPPPPPTRGISPDRPETRMPKTGHSAERPRPKPEDVRVIAGLMTPTEDED